jgi:hypothetical protein
MNVEHLLQWELPEGTEYLKKHYLTSGIEVCASVV